jgi:NADH dehydrogenase FAD-containing subunit
MKKRQKRAGTQETPLAESRQDMPHVVIVGTGFGGLQVARVSRHAPVRDVFVIGDTASRSQDGKPLPGVAPVAMQDGRYVARVITRRVMGKPPEPPFRYRDRGNLATVGRAFGIMERGRLHLWGRLARVLWLSVHIFYLIGFRTRVLVMIQWAWAYLTRQRSARLITCNPARDRPIGQHTENTLCAEQTCSAAQRLSTGVAGTGSSVEKEAS